MSQAKADGDDIEPEMAFRHKRGDDLERPKAWRKPLSASPTPCRRSGCVWV
jgi:hypothetical protein